MAQDQQRLDNTFAAASTILAKPIDLNHILELHSKSTESAEDFLESFRECYESNSGDRALNFHAVNTKYNAVLLNCLPSSVATAVKTNNLDWVDANPN
ncbi:hypothetical protein chiPu_0001211 [Chiloscyllium punctatum]|uniref:Uncharacterized protein n=1 Tax=Chiloscyllium punctatum TaxID=137246 RepID=A0A401RXE3_CHIPU|nr:hypothetical protein [Chiloscyllium punctatum]